MSTRRPNLTPEKLIKILKKHGFTISSQKGSHVKLYNCKTNKKTIVSTHKKTIVPKGTLNSILKQAGLTNEELYNY